MKKWLKMFSLLSLISSVVVVGNSSVAAQDREFEGQKVSVGVVGSEYEEIWEYVADKALRKKASN